MSKKILILIGATIFVNAGCESAGKNTAVGAGVVITLLYVFAR
jgi:hypothetical protein